MINSNKQTAPKYGFGTADRKKQAKVFQSKELSKTAFIGNFKILFLGDFKIQIGKTGPGPNYNITDKYSYLKVRNF